jgi:hypothetical protein
VGEKRLGADARGGRELWLYAEWVIAGGRRVTFAPGHWKIETQSHSIVVSARGWLVVNPLGVAEPTVGWKRVPLSVVA